VAEEEYDSRFSLPELDATASTEAGVVLMGLDAEQLLAGLGVATLADDPGSVSLLVDQLRHDALAGLSPAAMAGTGASRWVADRAAVERAAGAAVRGTMSLRDSWVRTVEAVRAGLPGDAGPATLAYLTACWLRRDDVDRAAAEARAAERIAR
jgi:hypothetical protein